MMGAIFNIQMSVFITFIHTYCISITLVFVKYFDLSLLTDGFGQGFMNGQKETFIVLVQKSSGIKKLEDL